MWNILFIKKCFGFRIERKIKKIAKMFHVEHNVIIFLGFVKKNSINICKKRSYVKTKIFYLKEHNL